MSEQPEETETTAPQGPLAGERLAAARRDQDITLADIARELHLDEGKVQALEQNQFDTLGAPVFAKGHLRKYAALVGVPIDDILADYYSLNRSTGAPPVVGAPRRPARDIDLTRWILPTLVVLLLAGGIGWWISAGSPLPALDGADDAAPDIELVTPLPVEADPAPAEDTTDSADGDDTALLEPAADAASAEQPGRAEVAATEVAADATPAPPAAAPVGPQVSLTLTYSGDCWTEVTDAAGTRLFFELGRAGSSIDVSGSAPLRVLFGNYANVSVEVDGRPYTIPASGRRGETARFTVNTR